MLIGYVCVSTDGDDQSTDLQRDALIEAGVDPRQIFEDRASGGRDDRPSLREALDYATEGDDLIVWKLDRLGRSLSHLLRIITELEKRGIGFRSLTQRALDTTTPEGRFFFRSSAPLLNRVDSGWGQNPTLRVCSGWGRNDIQALLLSYRRVPTEPLRVLE